MSLAFFISVIVILFHMLDMEESGYVITNSAEYEITNHRSEIGEVSLKEYDIGINIHIDDVADENTKSIEYNEDVMKYIEINFI